MARRRDEDFEVGVSERNPLTFGEQIFESDVQSNPLLFGRPSIYEQYREPVATPELEGISPEIAAANPLLAPPRPVQYMPVEQQIIWQEMQAQALQNQAALQNTLNANKLAARNADLEIKTRAQSGAILDALDELDPSSDDYDDKKSRLFQANPYGANSPEVQNIFKIKDEAANVRKTYASDQRKKTLETQEALRKETISQAKKDAAEIGDLTLMERVSQLSASDPDEAIRQVRFAKNRIVHANLVTQLREYGLPEQEIQAKYGSPMFADAAAARLKVEEAKRSAGEKIASESQLAGIVTDLNKRKAEGLAPDAAVSGKTWTPADEQMLQAYQNRLSVFATEPARTALPTPTVPTGLRGDELIRAQNELALKRAVPSEALAPEGAVMTDPKTGQRKVKRNGEWKPL